MVVERQRQDSGSLDSGARHGTSRAVTQGVGALGRGGSGLRKEGNGNERRGQGGGGGGGGGKKPFYKAAWQTERS